MEDFKNLVRISTYAKLKDISTETARLWVLNKKVKSVIIDDTIFIVKEEDKESKVNKK